MARARFVVMVPVEVEDDIIGDDQFMTEWGRQLAERYARVESLHPRQTVPYEPKLIEAVKLDDENEVSMDDLVTPGFAA